MKLASAKILNIFIFAILINGCTNPVAVIEPEIERFKTEYQDHIQKFKGKNREMNYAWSGDPRKRPVLFIHGSPGRWQDWSQFLLDKALQKKFHWIAIDRPGFGGSGAGIFQSSLAVQAADVIEVLKFNKSRKPAILVGYSFGGAVMAKAAIKFPEQVAGLVYVASSVSPDLEFTKWYQYLASWWPIKLFIPARLRVYDEEILSLKSELTLMLPYWKHIDALSVLIHGEQDGLVPVGNQDFLAQQLDHKNIVTIMRRPHLNHYIPWTMPGLISEGIQELGRILK